MEKKILVSYATTHGSTQEVAEVLAATIRDQGVAADVQPARSVKILDGYNAVILGSALYIGHAQKDALKFLYRFEAPLSSGLPIAIFAGGPLKPEDDCQEIRRMLDQDLARFSWLKPVAVELIGGKFDPSKGVKFPWGLLPAIKSMTASDLRDWEGIRKWTVNITRLFQLNWA